MYFFYWNHMERRTVNWENVSQGLSCRQVCLTFYWLKIDVGEFSPSWCYKKKKKVEQARRDKTVTSISPWLRLHFLPPGSCLDIVWWWGSGCQINPLLHKLHLVVAYYHSQGKQGKNLDITFAIISFQDSCTSLHLDSKINL